MSLCIWNHHRYRETPSIDSCPGCPRCILLRTACRSSTGTANLLSTRMQSSCTAVCDHRGFVYDLISSEPCFSPRSISHLSRSNQVSSDISSARRLLSKSFKRLSKVSSLDCLSIFWSSQELYVLLLGGSIVQISCSSSISSVVVRSTWITCTSFICVAFGCASDILIGTSELSSVAAPSSRVLFGGVLDSFPPNHLPE